jgi:hypothetical protein
MAHIRDEHYLTMVRAIKGWYAVNMIDEACMKAMIAALDVSHME